MIYMKYLLTTLLLGCCSLVVAEKPFWEEIINIKLDVAVFASISRIDSNARKDQLFLASDFISRKIKNGLYLVQQDKANAALRETFCHMIYTDVTRFLYENGVTPSEVKDVGLTKVLLDADSECETIKEKLGLHSKS